MGIFSKHFRKKTPQPAPKPAEPAPAKKSAPDPAPKTAETGSEFKQLMTSQLAALWLENGDEAYRKEYLRRMKICTLADADAEKMFEYETEILKAHPRPEMLEEQFVAKPLFNLIKPVLDHPVSHYETNFEYPLSYVVKLSDEAEWHFWNSHERSCLTDEAWAEIFDLSDRCRKLFLPFANDLLTRGWTVAAVNRFSYHEQGMLDRYRWGRSVTRAAKNPWQEG